ncbi:Response regulator [Sulfidibacter corallicola]|uniref:Response regulator n=1 Tax=Sulfidibacter corallicola TaxID=2818388 RepID=A0A8A4TMD6_SULCO|nr:HD domain-containing phosphohydrolase [Sulfidibacter corallicola]QTD51149.1 response regulator [Sulfidibacter corallicola]
MNRKVLIVDDDPHLLEGCQRQLRKHCDVFTAEGGLAGLRAIQDQGPFEVIVSDFRMPGMDGITFLEKASEVDQGAIHMMLSGQADMEAMIDVVNAGHIFRFLTKPCKAGHLAEAINAGFQQHRLIKAEKELLEMTLNGSIQMLVEVLSITNPIAFNRALRIKKTVLSLGKRLGLNNLWKLEIAAMLSQTGFVSVPNEVVQMGLKGGKLLTREEQMFWDYPKQGSHLVANIPRLEEVAQAIAYQEKQFDGGGYPEDRVKGEEIPMLSRVLKIVLDFDLMKLQGKSKNQIPQLLQAWKSRYDPRVFKAMMDELGFTPKQKMVAVEVTVEELKKGMVIRQNLKTNRGVLLVPAGVELNGLMIMRLRNFAANGALDDKINVLKPLEEET